MRKFPIDDDGFIQNPLGNNVPELISKKSWCGVVYRRGKKIQIASFLPSEEAGERINVIGISKGVYLAFGLIGSKERLIYLVNEVTRSDILLRPIEVSSVPRIYDNAGRSDEQLPNRYGDI
jgi:hypothetical protein